MILIVDSGSTKTSWCFAEIGGERIVVETGGINPAVQSEHYVHAIVAQQLTAEMQTKGLNLESIDEVFFYGAGCTPQAKGVVERQLHALLGKATPVSVESDLLGAARAVCGSEPGIACILGTGANSCLYDGTRIVAHTPALGYILGDEGSGAVLGRLFLNALLKGRLPQIVGRQFFDETRLSEAYIIERIYRSDAPNRFLASMSKFIYGRIDGCEQLKDMVVDNFMAFIKNNLYPYGNDHRQINAVGSMAYYYRPQLAEAASRLGYTIGRIARQPIELMADYHARHSHLDA